MKSQKSHVSLVINEVIAIAGIGMPITLTGFLLYARSMISMFFHSTIDELALSGGSFAIGFANITGYSILSGLAMGMEPICSQAFGAGKHTRLGLCLQKTIILLLFTSLPISLLWINMTKILLFCGQDEEFATAAQTYLLYSLPDLVVQSFLHPLRIYLRSQSITLPLTFCASLSVVLHVPINYFLVTKLGLGIAGVAISSVSTNFCLLVSLIVYILTSGVYKKTWGGVSRECLKGWNSLLSFAVPSCISFCLEQWRYEIMIMLCGSLVNPRATVASMQILFGITTLIYVFSSSLSSSVSTRVGNKLGAGRPVEARLAAVVGLCCSFVLGLSALFFTAGVRNLWAVMFTQDKEIIALTSLVMPIVGLCQLGNCLWTTGCGVLRGTGRPGIGAKINLGCFYLVGMPAVYFLGVYTGLDFEGLWLGMLLAHMLGVATMSVVLARMDWKEAAKRAKEVTDDGGNVVGGFNDEAVAGSNDDDGITELIIYNIS